MDNKCGEYLVGRQSQRFIPLMAFYSPPWQYADKFMQDVSTKNFGLLIAYLIPGFATLWGVSYFSPVVRSWLGSTADSSPSVGGFLYVTLASVSAGLTVSTIRWLVIDSIHHHTGIQQPNWDFSRLGQTVAAYDVLKEIHYRYFQFYSNSLVALTIAFALRWVAIGMRWGELGGVFLLCALFFLASRDTLRKYHSRVHGLLKSPA